MQCYHPNKAFTTPCKPRFQVCSVTTRIRRSQRPGSHFYRYALLPPEQGIHKALKATFLGTRCYHPNKLLGTRGKTSAPERCSRNRAPAFQHLKAIICAAQDLSTRKEARWYSQYLELTGVCDTRGLSYPLDCH